MKKDRYKEMDINNEDQSKETNPTSAATNEPNLRPIRGNFDFEHLKQIHFAMFNNVYEWAGETRDIFIEYEDEFFCLPENLESSAETIFARLKEMNYFCYEEEVIPHLANFFANLNYLHPFRDGNLRAQKHFVKMLAAINGVDLNLDNIQAEDLKMASIYSLYGQKQPFVDLFEANSKALPEELHHIMIYRYCSKEMMDYIRSYDERVYLANQNQLGR